jgi:hypothetical protein
MPFQARPLQTITTFHRAAIGCHERVTAQPYIDLRSSGLGLAGAEAEKVMWMSSFARLLENEIPRLRRYARALTRDAARADDLGKAAWSARSPRSICGSPAPIFVLGCSQFSTTKT